MIAARDLALPILTVVLGFLLFVGGIAVSPRLKEPGPWSLTFFGLIAALAYSGPILSLIPGFTNILSWTIAELIILGAWPPALSLWRRGVTTMGGRDHPILSMLDWIIAVAVAAWMILQRLAPPLDPRIAHLLLIDPRPSYISLSVAAGLLVWVARTAQSRNGRIGSFLILLAGIAPSLSFIIVGSPSLAFAENFIPYGLPAGVFLALPVLMGRRNGSNVEVGEPIHKPISGERFDGPEELETVEELPGQTMEQFEPLIDTPPPAPVDEESDALRRSLGSSLYPESLPWDHRWDAAAARQGYPHPSRGFYDIYAGSGTGIRGFSFMDSNGDDFESLMFAHLVRVELLRIQSADVSLPRAARTVHRKAVNAARASERTMKGFIGAFKDERLVFLPLAMPPLVLKRGKSGNIFSLQPPAGRASNPPLGSAGFSQGGLRTMSVSMNTGDTVLMFTPDLLEIRSPGGEKWGLRRLADSLRRETTRSSQGVMSALIQDLKDFAGVDELEGPIQLLVIRRR